VVESPQFASRDYFQSVEHSELGESFRYPGPFAKFSASPIEYRKRPPTVGEHNSELYGGELGLSEDEIAKLGRAGII
jgi:crotonobetainyl-CoA:carnitine CoA-transferase CaiB-like acyl-CoA transferase